jgi:SAM-dependent methyltransferase
MTGFSADWLALREPFDTAARAGATAVAATAAAWLGPAPRRIVDLACGTGANLRALAPRLGRGQHWRLVDHDAALLAALPEALRHWAGRHGYAVALSAGGTLAIDGPGFDATVVCQRLDLACELSALPLPPGALVTASALLDLVSAPWLDALIAWAAPARATLLFSLNVDGRLAWQPTDVADHPVHAAFAAHQRRDKGFGPALGPTAVAEAMGRLRAAGWLVESARSDWRIDGARSPAMLQALIDGTAAAAIEQAPGLRDTVLAWQQRRSAGRPAARLVVGHLDLAARPLT